MSTLNIGGISPETYLDQLAEKHGLVGACLLLIDGDQTQTSTYGLLNLNTGVEVTEDTAFQIGSIGKVFTATLVMQLKDAGRLALDDTVISHLPEFAIRNGQYSQQITIRQLLRHTSGIDGDFFPQDEPEGPSARGYLQKMRLSPSLYAPDAGPMTYCNSGYVVLGRLVEVLTGMAWEEAVMELICKPLGMQQAFARPHEGLRHRCAMGHLSPPEQPDQPFVSPVTYLQLSAGAAGSAISMSAGDLARFALAHLNGGKVDDDTQLLSAESCAEMQSEQVTLPPFSRRNFNQWGLGWMLGQHQNYRVYGHDGGTLGQYSFMRLFPDSKRGFILLTNSPSSQMFNELEDQYMRDVIGQPLAEDPAEGDQDFPIEEYLGEYQHLASEQSIYLDDDKLMLRMVDTAFGGPDIVAALIPHDRDIFTAQSKHPALQNRLVFLRDENGSIEFLRMGLRMAKNYS